MKIEFVTFETAKKLKEKGFKERCVAYYMPSGGGVVFNQTPFRGATVEDCLYSYNALDAHCIGSDCIDSPTVSQVLEWLIEKKKMYVSIDFYLFNGNSELWWTYAIRDIKDDSWVAVLDACTKRQSYEQAAIAGIEYVIDNLI